MNNEAAHLAQAQQRERASGSGGRPPRSGSASAPAIRRLVVIGNGMVSHKFVDTLLQRDTREEFHITVFGEEIHAAYDRVNLSSLFRSETNTPPELTRSTESSGERVIRHLGDPVSLIDREEKTVHSVSGLNVEYDDLVLATGSNAYLPNFPGNGLPGVFVYRSFDDLRKIRRRAAEAQSVAVVGGGLLGLETALALKDLGLRSHVIERGSGLLARQLNPQASLVLQRSIARLGVVVHNARKVSSVERRGDGHALNFTDGSRLLADFVVLATGVRPRDELARSCGLEVGRNGGVRIDDQLRTSDPSIFAIGECAMHNETRFGLVLPGYQMAEALADNFRGKRRRFTGADQSAILKARGVNVAALGDFQANGNAHTRSGNDSYRQVILEKGKLVGAISIGVWNQESRVRQAIDARRRIWPWQLRRFEASGQIWRDSLSEAVAEWPASVEVCNCTGVTVGQLKAACTQGCATVETLAETTGASTICGSCKPLLANFAGALEEPPTAPGAKWLLVASLAAVVGFIFWVLAPPVPFATSALRGWSLDQLWLDGFAKRVTGFTALGLSLLSLLLSLRKRIRQFSFGDFGGWRAVHGILGAATIVALVTHTGFRLGHNLNFLLAANFLALALFGGLAGAVTALERRLSGPVARRLRRVWTGAHVLLAWPLAPLVVFHVIKVYYY